MEFFSLVRGKRLPEIYHLSFNGTHFQIFVPPKYWSQFVEIAGEETYYASNQGEAYVFPRVDGGTFGQRGCAIASRTLDGYVCLEVPSFLENTTDENQTVTMRELGHTLASIFFILQHLLYDADEQKEEIEQGNQLQLFAVETFLIRDSMYHGAGLCLSLSPIARKYLEGLGKNIEINKAVEAMKEHFFAPDVNQDSRSKTWHGDFVVQLREYGVLHMNTRGNCACLGTMPQDFGAMGYALSSHNVDTVFQQFNLLVGIAHIWQIVRNGVLTKQF